MSPDYLESDLEHAAVALFRNLGWAVRNVMEEVLGAKGTLGRDNQSEVVLVARLRPALEKLNPDAPREAISAAIEELTRDRSAQSIVSANREIYRLVRNGVKVQVQQAGDEDGGSDVTVQVIDWREPKNNDYFVAQQLWVTGEIYKRRTDLVGFVNGLPLVFVELKGINENIKHAYDDNFRDYLNTIPQIFRYNAVVLLSNGFDNRIGSVTGAWDHFKEWKRIEREDEPAAVSLEKLLRGTCEPARLLDLVENFTLFSEAKSSVAKIVAQNHQFLGVNNALAAVRRAHLNDPKKKRTKEDGRLGVFWHTQGSGKSFSMVFFSQKILRTLPGTWTFVIVTDREDLDDQIYKTFASCGAVTEKNVQAKSAEHLRQLLGEDHRYVFTLIQKFRTEEKGARYPEISKRSDIIVIADEAHRSQYDTFALNLRNALPNAAFIGFTGTPLLAGEERTKEVFGDYVSVYNFRQAIEDHATVPLYYEARLPQLQLSNEDLADELKDLIDSADLDEEQQEKLEREFARQYHIVTNPGRLDAIAEDIVRHFEGLPRGTKGMVVAIDKLTAVRLYDKVRTAWQRKVEALNEELSHVPYAEQRRFQELQDRITYLAGTDMAVVVSGAQNEEETFKKKGLDIRPHRLRMVKEDLDTKFKDEKDPLRLVFVCAMWMTGFDVPSCGAIYLDKPMRNHTLMQTIARANRVFEGKESGVIVDYIGVFRNLQKALAIYGTGTGGRGSGGESPVLPKEEQLEELAGAIEEARAHCEERDVELATLRGGTPLERLPRYKDAVDKLIHPDEDKKTFLTLAARVDRLYKAVGVDERKNAYAPDHGTITVLANAIRAQLPPVDIADVMEAVEKLLNDSIAPPELADDLLIFRRSRPVHLGGIDFEALARAFAADRHKATKVAAIRVALTRKVDDLVRLNPTLGDLHAQLQALIDDYNAGADGVEEFFRNLVELAKKVEAAAQRPTAEGLSTEEMAFFDLLMTRAPKLTKKERAEVQKIAKDLPANLAPRLVIDWRKRERTRAAVRQVVRQALEALPEEKYPDDMFDELVAAVYEHVFESYWGDGQSKYGG